MSEGLKKTFFDGSISNIPKGIRAEASRLFDNASVVASYSEGGRAPIGEEVTSYCLVASVMRRSQTFSNRESLNRQIETYGRILRGISEGDEKVLHGTNNDLRALQTFFRDLMILSEQVAYDAWCSGRHSRFTCTL